MSYIEYVRSEPQSVTLLPLLAEANGFTMADLEANRRGRISDRQMLGLFRKAAGPLLYSAGVLAGWLVVVYLIYTFVPSFMLRRPRLLGGAGSGLVGAMLMVTLGSVGAFLVAMLSSTRRFILLMADCAKGKALFVEGRVTPSVEDCEEQGTAKFQRDLARDWGGAPGPTATVSRYHYVIKDEYFAVGMQACRAIEPRMNYRLYFAASSRLLLSIEPVTSHQPNPPAA